MKQWQQLANRFAALNRRERILVWAAGTVALVMSWYMIWAEPTLQARARISNENVMLETQLEAFQQQLAGEAMADPAVAKQNLLQQARLRSVEVQQEIDTYAAELISPTEMARVMEKVLARRDALQLRHLANHGAEDLLPAETPGDQRLYRHRFVLELEGPYLECLAYLEDLEALPWRLYWQAIEIESDKYPVNRIRIEVATLSLHEEWIGV